MRQAISHVLWHDIECGSYTADLPLWRDLATGQDGPVLDVGAGTGRVACDLAARGHAVVALDADADLLAALRSRPHGGDVETVVADARSFALARVFELILVPMQTVQLLGVPGRAAFLRAARAHLAPGGILACAIVEQFESFDLRRNDFATPDEREVDGVLYSSQPVSLRDEGERCAIERARQVTTRHGRRTIAIDRTHLARLDAATLEREGRAAGFTPEPALAIAETADHVSSLVVILRG